MNTNTFERRRTQRIRDLKRAGMDKADATKLVTDMTARAAAKGSWRPSEHAVATADWLRLIDKVYGT